MLSGRKGEGKHAGFDSLCVRYKIRIEFPSLFSGLLYKARDLGLVFHPVLVVLIFLLFCCCCMFVCFWFVWLFCFGFFFFWGGGG